MNSKFLLLSLLTAIVLMSYECAVKDTTSHPIVVNQAGEILLFGEKTDIENLQLLLTDSLERMEDIPDTIAVHYETDVLMGMRGEIETEVAEAIAAAKANRRLVRVDTVAFKKEKGTDCDQPDTLRTNCAYIDVQYPQIKRGSKALTDSVEQWTNTYLIGILAGGDMEEDVQVTTLDEAAKVFFDNHESYKGSAMYGSFVAESSTEILLNDETYLTLAMDGYTFQGGAHGSPVAALATFDIPSGKQFTWDDLVTDKAALTKIAEQKFRAERAEIFADGFEFDEIFQFQLPANYGLTEEGIYFHYVPYEVGPYAIGSTTFTLPFSQMGSLSKIRPTRSATSQDDPDLVAITDVIHNFYSWYDDFQQDDKRNITFTTEKDNRLVLDMPKVQTYFSTIKKSGYISDILINNEIAALKKCEELWKNESLDEPPSCLDYDRFFCAQDWDLNFWTQAPVGVEGLGADNVLAVLSGDGQEQKFDLQKENGKWLITKIYCE